MKLDDILTRKRDAADNTIALFQDGKLKPGVLASMVTDKLRTVDNTAASLKIVCVKCDKYIGEF